MQQPGPSERFFLAFKDAFHSSALVKLTLSQQRQKKADLKSIVVTPVMLKKGLMLHFVFRYKTRDISKNFSLEDALAHIASALDQDFYHADMYQSDVNVKLLLSPSGKARLLEQDIAPLQPVSLEHNRTKSRLIETAGNVYLRELGVTNAQGEVRFDMKDKYLQINRYVELLDPWVRQLQSEKLLRVADMGSGKGYLTFAMYDYMVHNQNLSVQMTGVEFRADLVDKCNAIAEQCNYTGLTFAEGTIESIAIDNPDILIALHACDTATDDAIYRGIEAQARLIVCAPCCHKQIRKEMRSLPPVSPVLKHGILLERQAEIITDALRALIMEAHGYKTRVFEFVSTEHTPKNLMIVGRKQAISQQAREAYLMQIRELKQLYGITRHYLETLLGI